MGKNIHSMAEEYVKNPTQSERILEQNTQADNIWTSFIADIEQRGDEVTKLLRSERSERAAT